MAVLKKFHKVCVGCNHGDYTPPSFLEFLTQIFIFFMVVEIQLIMWVHWLFNAKEVWVAQPWHCMCTHDIWGLKKGKIEMS